MKISVVVPTHNRAGLIRATLDSILAQETPPEELIVVDDGSTDDTQAVLHTYQSRIRTIRVENGGAALARNTGLRAASGRLVAFCDSDDLWCPGFLTAMASLWDRVPDLTTAYGNFRAFRDDVWARGSVFERAPPGFWEGLRIVGPGLGIFDQPIVGRLIGAGLSVYQPFYPSAMVVERTAFLNAGGWEELEPAEDYSTFLRAAERPIGIVQHALVGYRRHSTNYSAVSYGWNDGLRHTVNRRVIIHARILAHVVATRPALKPHRQGFLAKIGERRVGKECKSQCRSRWSPHH